MPTSNSQPHNTEPDAMTRTHAMLVFTFGATAMLAGAIAYLAHKGLI